MKKLAANAFAIEIANNVGFGYDGAKTAQAYIDMGLISVEEVQNSPQIQNVLQAQLLSLINYGNIKTSREIASKYLPDETPFMQSGEVMTAAKHGFEFKLSHYPEEVISLAAELLPQGYLESDEARAVIEKHLKEAINNGWLGRVVTIISGFNTYLPKEYKSDKIWHSEVAKKLETDFKTSLKEGSFKEACGMIETIGLPKHLKRSRGLKKLIYRGLRENTKSEFRAEETAALGKGFYEREYGFNQSEWRGIWKKTFTSHFLMQVYNGENGYSLRNLFSYSGKLEIESYQVSEKEIAIFAATVTPNLTQLTEPELHKIYDMCLLFPQLKKHLNIPAGSNYPQNATVNDLIEIGSDKYLLRSALDGLTIFTVDEVREIVRLLDKPYATYTSNESVPFFNVLQRSGILRKITEAQKQQIVEWVIKWGKQAEEVESRGDKNHENVVLAKRHWQGSGHHQGETVSRAAETLYRKKAVVFADAIEIFDDPELISRVGEFIDQADPIKLDRSTQRLKKMMAPNFRDVVQEKVNSFWDLIENGNFAEDSQKEYQWYEQNNGPIANVHTVASWCEGFGVNVVRQIRNRVQGILDDTNASEKDYQLIKNIFKVFPRFISALPSEYQDRVKVLLGHLETKT